MTAGTRLSEKTLPYASAADGRTELGRRGEEAAGRHLLSLGYRILERRYRTRAGEIDFIARDGEAIVFIEVKTRTSLRCGRPAEAESAPGSSGPPRSIWRASASTTSPADSTSSR